MNSLELTQNDNALLTRIQQSGDDPVILTVGGKPYAAVVSVETLDELVALRDELEFTAEVEAYSNSQHLRRILDRSWQDYQTNGGIALEDIDWDELAASAPTSYETGERVVDSTPPSLSKNMETN